MGAWTTASPWIALCAAVICLALAARAVMLFRRVTGDESSAVAWYSASGATLLAVIAIFFFYFAARAGEADPRPLQKEGMTEINEQAPSPPTKAEIKEDFRGKEKAAFEQSFKTLEEHATEANDSIDKALKRAKERDGK